MIIMIVIIGIYGYKNITKEPLAPGQYDEFAQYLTEQGAIMYGTEWCPHCKNQKALFGNSFQYINYIDCDKESNICDAAEVKGFPTWEIDGRLYPGEQSFEELSLYSGVEFTEG